MNILTPSIKQTLNNATTRPYKKWLFPLLMLVFGLIATGFTVTQISAAIPEKGRTTPQITVPTIEIEPVDHYNIKRTFIGRMEAARTSDLGFELAGKVSRILFDEGDQVKQGEVLAYLDIDRLQARKKELLATLQQAKANRKLAVLTYQRYKKVVKFNGVSNQQLDEAREHWHATKAAANLVESQIKTVDVDIAKSQLHAPFAAVVSKRRVDEGQILGLGEPVFQLLENAPLEARIAIAGPLINSIEQGQIQQILVNQIPFQAIVKAIIPVRDGRTRTVDVILSLSRQSVQLRVGDLAKLELNMKVNQGGLWLPVSALSEDTRGIWSVYTVQPVTTQEDIPVFKVQRYGIEIIHAGSDRVFVQSLVNENLRIVVDGLHRIVPGQLVQLSTSLTAKNRKALQMEQHHENS